MLLHRKNAAGPGLIPSIPVLPSVARIDARRITSNLSIAAQPQQGSTNYHGGDLTNSAQLNAWTQWCADSNIEVVRGAVLTLDANPTAINPYSLQWLARMRALGLKALCIVTKEGDDGDTGIGQTVAETSFVVQTLLDDWSDVVHAVEGPNEPNHARGGGPIPPNWLGATWDHQKAIYDVITAESSAVPIIMSSLHDTAADQNGHYAQVGSYTNGGLSFSDICDYAGLHMYAGGRRVTDKLATRVTAMAPLSLPLWITEAGWHNALYDPSGHWPTDEVHAGYLMERAIMEICVGMDMPHVLFEVLDQANAAKDSNQAHFGAIRVNNANDNDTAQWVTKPTGLAVADWMTHVKAHNVGASDPTTPIGLDISGSGLEWTVLGHLDGSTTVAAWQTTHPWDPGSWSGGSANYGPVSMSNRTLTVVHAGGTATATVGKGVARIHLP